MASRRCSHCSVNWPAIQAYKECPSCGEDTSWMQHAVPLPADEARSKVAHLEFERWLENESPEEREARQARAADDVEFARVREEMERELAELTMPPEMGWA